MKHSYRVIMMAILLSCLRLSAQETLADRHSIKIWYDHPAARWTEALPIGNGRLGAMIFGRPQEELLQLNESTLWSGGPVDQRKPGGRILFTPDQECPVKPCRLCSGRQSHQENAGTLFRILYADGRSPDQTGS
jgi:Glycosyl hydrolase family 65, N-terminal domain